MDSDPNASKAGEPKQQKNSTKNDRAEQAYGRAKDPRASLERLQKEYEGGYAKPPIKLEWFHEIQPNDQEWLVHEILPRRGIVGVFGESGAGKSFVAIDWDLRIAAGLQVMGVETERVGVAYLGPEGTAGLRKRIAAWRKHHEIEGELPFVLIGNSLDLRTATAEDVTRLIESLNAAKPAFVAAGAPLGIIEIDTLASVTPGSAESASEGMGAAVAALQRIEREVGVLVVIVHHAGHSNTDRMRGWSGLPAALDTIIEVSHEKSTKLHTITLRKQKDADGERPIGCFRRHKVELGLNRRGLPIVGAVIEYEDAQFASVKASGPRPKPSDAPMLKAIRDAISKHGKRPPVHLQEHIPSNAEVVQRARVMEIAKTLLSSQSDVTVEDLERASDSERQAWGRSIKNLIGQGIIMQYAPSNREAYIWLCRQP